MQVATKLQTTKNKKIQINLKNVSKLYVRSCLGDLDVTQEHWSQQTKLHSQEIPLNCCKNHQNKEKGEWCKDRTRGVK